MSKGVLLYAHNNEAVNYAKLAICSAVLVRINMSGTPIALITDHDTGQVLRRTPTGLLDRLFDHIIIVERAVEDNHRQYVMGENRIVAKYRNADRPTCYDLSPFDETLLIDSDLLILDNSLSHVWDGNFDLLMNRKAIFASDFKEVSEWRRLDPLSIPLYWATQVFFRRTKEAEEFFKLVAYVQANYAYYAKLYRFDAAQYRNDFSFSVAAHILNGEIELPGCIGSFGVDHILSVRDPGGLIEVLDRSRMVFAGKIADDQPLVPVQIQTNIHCMNKKSILDHSKKIIELYQYDSA